MHHLDANKTAGEEARRQYWISPGGNTPQSTNNTVSSLSSRKLSKLDEPDTQDTDGEAEKSSEVMYSYGPPHMAEQKQDDQLCEDTGCSPEDLPVAMNDREKWWEKIRDIRASGTTWYIYIYIYYLSLKWNSATILPMYICIYIYVLIWVSLFSRMSTSVSYLMILFNPLLVEG